jgi:hypothetical protein
MHITNLISAEGIQSAVKHLLITTGGSVYIHWGTLNTNGFVTIMHSTTLLLKNQSHTVIMCIEGA